MAPHELRDRGIALARGASHAAGDREDDRVRLQGSEGLHVGELVRFENEGYLVHMDVAIGAKSAKAAAKIAKGLAAGQEKGLKKFASGSEANFAGPLSSGAFQQETIADKPGWYVQACFMPTQDGRPHTLLGMERVIEIVK